MAYHQCNHSSSFSPGTEFHDSRRGWGTVSKTGKTVSWDTYCPLTKRQIEAENRRRAKRNEWLKTPEGQAYIRRTDQLFDDMLAKHGTSREKMSNAIFDIIDKAPPFGALFST